MQSCLRIRKKKNYQLGLALREAHRIRFSAEEQALRIDEAEFEEIDLRLIDPGLPILDRLEILETQIRSSNQLAKKSNLFLIVLVFLERYVVGEHSPKNGASVLLNSQEWSLAVGQGLMSKKVVQQLTALKIMIRLVCVNYKKVLEKFGFEIVDELLSLYGSSQKSIKSKILWILHFLSQDEQVFNSVFSDFDFRADIAHTLEKGISGQESLANVALFPAFNLLREIKYEEVPQEKQDKFSEKEFIQHVQTEQLNVAVVLVQYLKLPQIQHTSHYDALRAIVEYVATDCERSSFLAQVGILDALQSMISAQNNRVTLHVLKFLIHFTTLEDKILEAKLLNTGYIEKLAKLLCESNNQLIMTKAALILANLVASSQRFIQKFIDTQLFQFLGECLNCLSDNYELNKSIILALGNGAFSANKKQIPDLLDQKVVDALITKAYQLSIMDHQGSKITLYSLLRALEFYLKRADQHYRQEKMPPKSDLFSDLSSPKWGGQVSSLAYKLLITYCGFEENEVLFEEDNNIDI